MLLSTRKILNCDSYTVKHELYNVLTGYAFDKIRGTQMNIKILQENLTILIFNRTSPYMWNT